MKLSIITINLNNKVGLQKTIDSVITQTYKNFEWIVIDGGSTDGSKELIEQYTKYITYWVSESDKGIYNAMNKGIRASHGEYLLFLNSGDYFYDNVVLSNTVLLLKGKDYYVGRQQYGDRVLSFDVSTYEAMLFWVICASLPHQSTFINNRIFEIYGLYNENRRIVSDWEMFYNTVLYGNVEAENLPFVISVHNQDGISCRELDMVHEERKCVKNYSPGVYALSQFYRNNYVRATTMSKSRWLFFIYRACYWIYSKTHKGRY